MKTSDLTIVKKQESNFLQNCLIYPGKTIYTKNGKEYATKLDRMLFYRGTFVNIGSISFGVIPNLSGKNFDPAYLAKEYAELLQIPTFIQAREVSKDGITIYNSYWSKARRIVRLFVRKEEKTIRYAMAMYRKSYAKTLNLETEILGAYLMERSFDLHHSFPKSISSLNLHKAWKNISLISSAHAQILPWPLGGGTTGSGGSSGADDYSAGMQALATLGTVDWNSIVEASKSVTAASEHFQKLDMDQINSTMAATEGAMSNVSNIDTDQLNKTLASMQGAADNIANIDTNQVNRTLESVESVMRNLENLDVQQANSMMASIEGAMNKMSELDVEQVNATFSSIENAMNTMAQMDMNQLNSTMAAAQQSFEKISELDVQELNTMFANGNTLLQDLDGKVSQFDMEGLNSTISNANNLITSANDFINNIDQESINKTLQNLESASATVDQYLKDFDMDGINSIIGNVNDLTGAITPEDIQKLFGNVDGITSNVEGITGDVKTVTGTFAEMFSSPEKAALTFASAVAIKTLTSGVVNLALDGVVKGMGALIRKLKGNNMTLEEQKKLFIAAMSKYDSHLEKIGKLESELDKMISFFEKSGTTFDEMLAVANVYQKNTGLSQDVVDALKKRLEGQMAMAKDDQSRETFACMINSLTPIETEIQEKIELAANMQKALQFDGLSFNGMKGKDALCGYFNHILDSVFFLEYQMADLRDTLVIVAPDYIDATLEAAAQKKKKNFGEELKEIVTSYVHSEKEANKRNALYVLDTVKQFKDDCKNLKGCAPYNGKILRIVDGKLLLHRENPFITGDEEEDDKFFYKGIRAKDFQSKAQKELEALESLAQKRVSEIEADFAKLAAEVNARVDLNPEEKLELLNRFAMVKNSYVFNVEQQQRERVNTIKSIIHYASYKKELKNKPKRDDYLLSGKDIKEISGLNEEELSKEDKKTAKEMREKLRAERAFINNDWRKDHKQRVKSNAINSAPLVDAHIGRIKTFINDLNCRHELGGSAASNKACDTIPFSESKRFQDLMRKQAVVERACKGKKAEANSAEAKKDRLLNLDEMRNQLELKLDKETVDASISDFIEGESFSDE